MKAKLKKWTRELLRYLAKNRLKKIQPKIIGVTGSVGKTSAKEAIAGVLERRFLVHKSPGGYNSDFGICTGRAFPSYSKVNLSPCSSA